jgi:hypothetical protein
MQDRDGGHCSFMMIIPSKGSFLHDQTQTFYTWSHMHKNTSIQVKVLSLTFWVYKSKFRMRRMRTLYFLMPCLNAMRISNNTPIPVQSNKNAATQHINMKSKSMHHPISSIMVRQFAPPASCRRLVFAVRQDAVQGMQMRGKWYRARKYAIRGKTL